MSNQELISANEAVTMTFAEYNTRLQTAWTSTNSDEYMDLAAWAEKNITIEG